MKATYRTLHLKEWQICVRPWLAMVLPPCAKLCFSAPPPESDVVVCCILHGAKMYVGVIKLVFKGYKYNTIIIID